MVARAKAMASIHRIVETAVPETAADRGPEGEGIGLWMAILLIAGALFLFPDSAPAQGLPRASRAHEALNSAIEHHRRGEYEQAAADFQQAQAGQSDLTPSECQELARVMQANSVALQARQSGSDTLRQAEKALREGRLDVADDLLKRVNANQYLLPADRQKAQQLAEQVRPRSLGSGEPTVPVKPLSLARSKLQQARAMMAQGSFDAAEQLAREA